VLVRVPLVVTVIATLAALALIVAAVVVRLDPSVFSATTSVAAAAIANPILSSVVP
jgi:hypothetical protein